MKLGLVGATGLVGQHFLKLLEQDLKFPLKELRLFSRQPKVCYFAGKQLKTQVLAPEAFKGLDVCFFSAGAEVSRVWAPQAVEQGTIVIDNSSAFRSDPDKLLIVPEVNADLLEDKAQIISNPNCSTIQLVVALKAIHKAFGLQSVHVVSFQSISGAGRQALEDLKQQSREILEGKQPYEQSLPLAKNPPQDSAKSTLSQDNSSPQDSAKSTLSQNNSSLQDSAKSTLSQQSNQQESIPSAFNCVPYIGPLAQNGFCEEEIKIMTESRKILNLPELAISAFTVRVPCLNGHSEWVRFSVTQNPTSIQELQKALLPYVKVLKNPPHARYASGKKEVFVGRLHKDSFLKNSWLMWLVADNLLKGASLNGLQIAEELWNIKSSARQP